MSCDNVITVQDLETDKKHSTFYREVITGKAGGTGADIDSATNAVTGQAQATLPKVINDLDWSYVGLFADGVTFTDKTDFAVDAVGTQWIYTGSLPFSATAGTVPSEPTYQAVHVKSHAILSDLNPADGSAHNADDIGFSTGATVELAAYTTATVGTEMTYDILFVYGQSNALGKPALSGNTTGFPTILPHSLCFDVADSTIKPIYKNMLSWSQGADSTSSGHAWAEFANEYYRQSGRGIILILGAEGGKTIAELSKGAGSGSTAYYENAVSGYTALQTYLLSHPEYNIGKTFAMFHQGESDQLAETEWFDYYAALVNLRDDLAADIGIEKLGICLVGNPKNRLERTWENIRNAQRRITYLGASAFIAFEGAATYSTLNGGISSEGVHYTQTGLNVMGNVAAINTVNVLLNASKTKPMSSMSAVKAVMSQQSDLPVKSFSGVLTYTGGLWQIISKDVANTWGLNSVYKVINNSDSLDIYLSGPLTKMFYVDVDVETGDDGLKIIAKKSIISDSDGVQFVRVRFLADFSVGIPTDLSGLRYGITMSGVVPAWVSAMVSNSVTSGTATVAHNSVTSPPDVTMYAPSGFTTPNLTVKYRANSATSSEVRVESTDGVASTSSPRVSLHFKDMVMTPANLAVTTTPRIFVKGMFKG